MSRSTWIEPIFSKTQVDRAGRVLISDSTTVDEFEAALQIFSNWRAAHGYPLNTVQIVLRGRVRRVANTAIVSQRHKREFSIVRKLERAKTMRLTQMQDIAGCRAVMKTMGQVVLIRKYFDPAEIRDDYITAPANSGYRSLHLVSSYRGKNKTVFDGLFIETQIRSALQHAWATAVETVDTFLGSDLKSGFGEEKWKRLFALIGSAFAMRERTTSVPGTPARWNRLVQEIKALEEDLCLLKSLEGWHVTSQTVRNPAFRFKKYLIIEQRPNTGVVKLHTYAANEFDEATKRYSELEQEVTKDNRSQVVMASADSFSSLKRAYPNLFVNPTEFIKAYQRVLSFEL